MGACGGGRGSSSSGGSDGGSGAILFLIVVAILLLFARPLCRHCPSPFRCPLRAMVGCWLLLSTALFVVARHPAIIDDCVTGRPPPAAHSSCCSCVTSGQRLCCSLVPMRLSLLLSSSRAAVRGAGLSVGTKPWRMRPAGPPALAVAAVVAVLTVRRGGGRTKPCAAPLIRMWVVRPPAAARQSCCPSSFSAIPLPHPHPPRRCC